MDGGRIIYYYFIDIVEHGYAFNENDEVDIKFLDTKIEYLNNL